MRDQQSWMIPADTQSLQRKYAASLFETLRSQIVPRLTLKNARNRHSTFLKEFFGRGCLVVRQK